MIKMWKQRTNRVGLHRVRFSVTAITIPMLLCSGRAAVAADADLVVIHARIWTGVETKHAVEPTALAVRLGGITAVGSDESVRVHIGPATTVIDAGGRRVIPGITDSHTHLVSGGFGLARLQLRDVHSRVEFISAVQTAASGKKPGAWVLGGRWSVESWKHPEPPNKGWLDPFTQETPVLLSRMDGHQALANSAALRAAGITTSGPPDPVGGEIERDPDTKEPTGILKESAMDLVRAHLPHPTEAERLAALRRAMKHANTYGITSVHDMSAPEDIEVFRHAYNNDVLTLRIVSYVQAEDWASAAHGIAKTDLRGDMLAVVGLKGYIDGSLGSRTAYMRAPYSDATPQARYPRGQLTAFARSATFHDQVAEADRMGLQMAMHAIGDAANHLVLDAYENDARGNRKREEQHRIEHAQHLLVSDIPRFAKLGIVASMQPYHKADDGRYAEKALGTKRLAGSYAYRQLLDAGALVCFGSDWPVVTMNPFAGMDSAVNARTLTGKVWLPSHSINVEEAMRAYTVSPQRVVHREDRLGTLEVGKLADFVILESDPFTVPKERLGEVNVWRTFVDGREVYSDR